MPFMNLNYDQTLSSDNFTLKICFCLYDKSFHCQLAYCKPTYFE